MRVAVPFAAVALLSLAAAPALAQDAPQGAAPRVPDVIYVPTPDELVATMLDLAKVGPDDVVYDLGCGDGRLVIAAAKRGARAIGVDIDPDRIAESRANARKAKVEDRVTFLEQDLFQTDISDATVVTLYLLPQLNLKLRPKLQALRPGTRVVSHAFDMGDWTPEQTVHVDGRTAYLWTIGPQPGRPAAQARDPHRPQERRR